ncbi:hypothetical protein A9Z42_0081390 [Trichoderma parareesei]|uniref:Uncharacterized protein n=1 Tax=Trichoderma parareesei TaxID=858221 RepID=A0A2H2ZHX6_TRIPA|nr:hypothetical protein A9Z42_0081390 [Trichoderma parareesei]
MFFFALPGCASSRHNSSLVSSCLIAPVIVSVPARRQGWGRAASIDRPADSFTPDPEHRRVPQPEPEPEAALQSTAQLDGHSRTAATTGIPATREWQREREQPGRQTKEDWRRSSPAWLQRRPATDLEVRFEPPLPAASSFVCCYRTASLNSPST